MLGQLGSSLQRLLCLPGLLAFRDVNTHSHYRYLLHKLAALEGEELSLLDVGCRTGSTLRHLAMAAPGKIGRYVGIGHFAGRLKPRFRNLSGIDVVFHDVDLDADWDVGRFDVVWCPEVIEPSMSGAGQIAKVKRAATPGGMVLMTMPCLDFVEHVGASLPPILAVRAIKDGDHDRLGYGLRDIEQLAADAGLTIQSIDGVNRLTPSEAKLRYTARGASRVVNNIRLGWRTRNRRDFVIGDAFKAAPERYTSIGADLMRPVEPVRMRAAPEAIALSLPKTMVTAALRPSLGPAER